MCARDEDRRHLLTNKSWAGCGCPGPGDHRSIRCGSMQRSAVQLLEALFVTPSWRPGVIVVVLILISSVLCSTVVEAAAETRIAIWFRRGGTAAATVTATAEVISSWRRRIRSRRSLWLPGSWPWQATGCWETRSCANLARQRKCRGHRLYLGLRAIMHDGATRAIGRVGYVSEKKNKQQQKQNQNGTPRHDAHAWLAGTLRHHVLCSTVLRPPLFAFLFSSLFWV